MSKQTALPASDNPKADISVGLILGGMVLLAASLWWLAARFNATAMKGQIMESSCNLHLGVCRETLPWGTLEVRVSPYPIPLMKSIEVEVNTEGFQAQKMEVAFMGVDMDMGINQQQLKRVEEVVTASIPSSLITRYRAKSVLPICSTGKMLWRMLISIQLDQQTAPTHLQWTFSTPP